MKNSTYVKVILGALVLVLGLVMVKCQSGSAPKENKQNEQPFYLLTQDQKEETLRRNVTDFVNQNQQKTAVKNYEFLLKYSNMLMPEPTERLKNIGVYFNDTITAEAGVYFLNPASEYLNDHPQFGTLDMYGIQFIINDSTGGISDYKAYFSFVKWSNEKVGSRHSLGMKYFSVPGEEVFNFQDSLGNAEKMRNTEMFNQATQN